MEKIILVGSGQHCNVVMYNVKAQGKYEIACIAEIDHSKCGKYIDGIPVVPFENFSTHAMTKIEKEFGTNKFIIAFGSMRYRKDVFNFLVDNGWEAITVIHPHAVVSPTATIGKGVLIECGCLITPSPVIGDNVVVNTGSQVNHDNIVESHVYIASGVILSGGVTIKENTLLDDGVIITLGSTVGKNCIIGAGAVVTKEIPDNVVAYGSPCRVIRDNK